MKSAVGRHRTDHARGIGSLVVRRKKQTFGADTTTQLGTGVARGLFERLADVCGALRNRKDTTVWVGLGLDIERIEKVADRVGRKGVQRGGHEAPLATESRHDPRHIGRVRQIAAAAAGGREFAGGGSQPFDNDSGLGTKTSGGQPRRAAADNKRGIRHPLIRAAALRRSGRSCG